MRVTLEDRDPGGGTPWFTGVESLVSGASAGLVTSVITCPLDVVKTKIQAGEGSGGPKALQGVAGIFKSIWKNQGYRGLYRGLGSTVIGYIPTWAIYFTVYDKVKAEMKVHRGEDDSVTHIIAAMTAGATGTIITNPLWVVKTRFMTQKPAKGETRYRHTGDAIIRIYKTEGLTSFYRGMFPSLIGVSHIALQFPLYEKLKVLYRPPDGSDIPSSTILFCSSASKMIASVATYPHEVLRTRLQIQKHLTEIPPVLLNPTTLEGGTRPRIIPRQEGVVETCKRIVREEGLAGFYRGMGVNLLRTVPASAMTILTYEVIMRRLVASHK